MIGPFGGGGGGVAASAYMRALLLEPNAAAARVALGLGSAAESDASDFAAAAHTHSAADIVSGTIGAARLGSGAPDATKFLRGDSAWVVIDLSAYETIAGAAATYLPLVGGTLSGALTIAGASVAASTPLLTITQTWNNAAVAFTGIKANFTDTASTTASLLLDLQVGGVSKFGVWKEGIAYVGAKPSSLGGFAGLPAYWLIQPGFESILVGICAYALGVLMPVFNGIYRFRNDYFEIGLSTGTVQLYPDTSHALGLRNGTNSQSFRVYDTYTDGSNYRRVNIFGGNAGAILLEGVGSGINGEMYIGTAANMGSVFLRTGGTDRWKFHFDSGALTQWSAGNITLLASNFILDVTTGTKIGTAANQKIGLWGATPVVQPAHIADPAGGGVVDAEARAAIVSILDQMATTGWQAAA